LIRLSRRKPCDAASPHSGDCFGALRRGSKEDIVPAIPQHIFPGSVVQLGIEPCGRCFVLRSRSCRSPEPRAEAMEILEASGTPAPCCESDTPSAVFRIDGEGDDVGVGCGGTSQPSGRYFCRQGSRPVGLEVRRFPVLNSLLGGDERVRLGFC
jgi:hypothetical protein